MENEEENCEGCYYRPHSCVLPFGPFGVMIDVVSDTERGSMVIDVASGETCIFRRLVSVTHVYAGQVA